MIAVVIGVLAVLVVAAIIWARIGASRAENRSVETYERALGVLGEVSKRTESTGFRILPHEETGRAHVSKRTEPGQPAAPPETQAVADQPAPLASRRLPPAGEPKLRVSGPSLSARRPPAGEGSADNLGEGPARRALAGAAAARARQAAYNASSERKRQVLARRAATGATAAVALAALAVAGLYLSGGGKSPNKKGTTTTTLHRGGSGGRTTSTTTSSHNTTTTTTTVATSVSPISLAPVTFRVPAGSYTLGFQVNGGDCWVGVERSSAGPWLFNQTLAGGQSVTYRGSGTLQVTLGAPAHFAMTLDGLAAQLPKSTQVYTFDLVPARS